MKLPVTLACGLYDRTFGLKDGSVPVEGVELNFLPMMPVETFRRQGRHAEFDASEFSLSTYMTLYARGDRRFVGIPVYPSRRFRHEHVWVNTKAGITSPKDLKDKRVGVQEFIQTAALWIRGFLQHDYGVRTEDMEWFLGGYNEPDPHFKPRIELEMKPGVKASVIPGDTCIDAMLERGELDAVLPAVPGSFRRGSPNVARLFPDFRAAEEDYFRRTRIFPIMHVVVIKRELYEKHPWVAQSLYKAFVKAKELAIRRLVTSPPLHATLPWLSEHIESTRRVMGDDYWSFGLARARGSGAIRI
jgi:4,5-dihydroxyphthalate decarboxylase